MDKAIKLKPDYIEALTYKDLLLRVQANLEKNPARQQALLKEADQYRDQAVRSPEQAARPPAPASSLARRSDGSSRRRKGRRLPIGSAALFVFRTNSGGTTCALVHDLRLVVVTSSIATLGCRCRSVGCSVLGVTQ